MIDHKPAVLIDLLKKEISWVSTLNELLGQEQVALANNQYEALEKLATEKDMFSGYLEESAAQRIGLLALAQHNNQPKAAMQAFLTECTAQETTQINELNSELAEKLLNCRQLNTVNGQVIATNITHRKEIIGALSGQETQKAIGLYNATGTVTQSCESSRYQKA